MEFRPLTVDELFARCQEKGLDPKLAGTGFHCRCPVHGDEGRDRHLYIHKGYKAEVVAYCHKGCTYQAVAAALELHEETLTPKSRDSGDFEQHYQWVDERGHLLFEEVRYYKGTKKRVFCRRPNLARPGEWINDLEGVRFTLYRLPQLLRADPGKVVLMAEGPKCAELLAQTGYPATCTPLGAGKWHLTDFVTPLIGRRVAVFPDYDEPGALHAREVVKRLKAAGIQAAIVQLPGYRVAKGDEKGKDVYDWVMHDKHDLDAALGLAESALKPRLLELTLQRQVELTEDTLLPPPLAAEVYWGITGEVINAIAPAVEAGLAALIINWLVIAGIYIGRGPHAVVAATKHYLNLFAATVADTGMGKGAAWDPIKFLMHLVDEGFHDNIHTGLSSGEGFVSLVRDPQVKREQVKKSGRWTQDFDEHIEDEGVSDKRCLVTETEFAGLLTVMGRQGNTISARLREAWDDGRLQILTKNAPLRATNAHIGVLAQVTPDDLRQRLTANDAANGFANRFLWCHMTREGYLPEGGRMPNMATLVYDVRQSLVAARGIGEITRDERARKLWNHLYRSLTTRDPGMLGAVTARAAPQVLRLSCLYAALDGSHLVTTDHLMAAYAIWDHVLNSVRYLWGKKLGDAVADQVYATIAIQPDGITKTQLLDQMGRHAKSTDLQETLVRLFRLKKIQSRRRMGDGGREVEVFEPTEEEKSAGSFIARGRQLLEVIDDLPLFPGDHPGAYGNGNGNGT